MDAKYYNGADDRDWPSGTGKPERVRACYNCGPGPLTETRWLCVRCRALYAFNANGAMVVKPRQGDGGPTR